MTDKSNEEILAMEARGESMEGVIKGNGRMMPPRAGAPGRRHTSADDVRHIARVNVDFTPQMLEALDAVAARIGINRQATIKEAIDAFVTQKIAAFEMQARFTKQD
ncbi:MAG: hypothetical protein NTZ90_10940 [Proteobacteria bacterium]|jgi:hypothetical protein|nr:hypothetical protein [Pseudomonadota bacterium]